MTRARARTLHPLREAYIRVRVVRIYIVPRTNTHAHAHTRGPLAFDGVRGKRFMGQQKRGVCLCCVRRRGSSCARYARRTHPRVSHKPMYIHTLTHSQNCADFNSTEILSSVLAQVYRIRAYSECAENSVITHIRTQTPTIVIGSSHVHRCHVQIEH